MSHVTMVSFCNLIGTARWQKSTTFLVDVTRLSPPPFVRRGPRDEANHSLSLPNPKLELTLLVANSM